MTPESIQPENDGFTGAKQLRELQNVSSENQPDGRGQAIQEASQEKLFGHSFKIKEINNNDAVPVGGKNRLDEKLDVFVRADFENFNDFIDENIELSSKVNEGQLSDWLEKSGINIDAATFAKLHTLTTLLSKRFPHADGGSQIRKQLYLQNNAPLLSEVTTQGAQECAEIALLSKAVLQREDIDSEYVSGDVLWSKNQEFSEEHSYLTVSSESNKYIYDPTNPTKTSVGVMPSIYEIPDDFDENIGTDSKSFVTAKNIISQKEAYFGVNNGMNVGPEDIH